MCVSIWEMCSRNIEYILINAVHIGYSKCWALCQANLRLITPYNYLFVVFLFAKMKTIAECSVLLSQILYT